MPEFRDLKRRNTMLLRYKARWWSKLTWRHHAGSLVAGSSMLMTPWTASHPDLPSPGRIYSHTAYLACFSFCCLRISSAFLAFSAFCSSTSFRWACTLLSRFRMKATSWRTSSFFSFLALSRIFLFSFSIARFSQRFDACRVSYSSFQAKFFCVQKLCQ